MVAMVLNVLADDLANDVLTVLVNGIQRDLTGHGSVRWSRSW